MILLSTAAVVHAVQPLLDKATLKSDVLSTCNLVAGLEVPIPTLPLS